MPGLHIRLTDTDACKLTKFATKTILTSKFPRIISGATTVDKSKKYQDERKIVHIIVLLTKKGLLQMIGAYFDS